jgi:protein gp37
MNKTKISWPWKPLWTWNPIFGCLNKCPDCYTEAMAKRFYKNFTPAFREGWLQDAELYSKTPHNIFIGSMADCFGEWVPAEWINKVLKTITEHPQHTYIFLTQNPVRYLEFNFPNNVWLGCTMRQGIKERQSAMIAVKEKGYRTFLSAEPLLGAFDNLYFQLDITFDLVIVGALSGRNKSMPEQEWIDSIRHHNIYYKKSMGEKYTRLNKVNL